MAGGRTTYQRKAIADYELGSTTYTPPTTVYIGLLTDTYTKTQRDAGQYIEVPRGTWTNYSRKAVTNSTSEFAAASGASASKTNSNNWTWDAATITSGTVTVTAVGVFDAAQDGNMTRWADLEGTEKIGTAIASTDTITSPAHGFNNNDILVVRTVLNATFPSGITDGTSYYVVNKSTDDYQLSLTLGGAAIDITGSGAITAAVVGSKGVTNTKVFAIAAGAITFTEA